MAYHWRADDAPTLVEFEKHTVRVRPPLTKLSGSANGIAYYDVLYRFARAFVGHPNVINFKIPRICI